jgi:hypothetical protein
MIYTQDQMNVVNFPIVGGYPEGTVNWKGVQRVGSQYTTYEYVKRCLEEYLNCPKEIREQDRALGFEEEQKGKRMFQNNDYSKKKYVIFQCKDSGWTEVVIVEPDGTRNGGGSSFSTESVMNNPEYLERITISLVKMMNQNLFIGTSKEEVA